MVFSRARDQIGSRLPESPGGARLIEKLSVEVDTLGARSLPDEGRSLSLVMAFVLAIGVFQRHPVAATPNTGARIESYEARKQTFQPTPRTLLAREVPTFEEKRTI